VTKRGHTQTHIDL